MNIKTEVSITLQEQIKAMGAAVNVTWQMVTQSIDARIPDIDDANFDKIIAEAKIQVESARDAWMKLNCAA
jgi:predicted aconitase